MARTTLPTAGRSRHLDVAAAPRREPRDRTGDRPGGGRGRVPAGHSPSAVAGRPGRAAAFPRPVAVAGPYSVPAADPSAGPVAGPIAGPTAGPDAGPDAGTAPTVPYGVPGAPGVPGVPGAPGAPGPQPAGGEADGTGDAVVRPFARRGVPRVLGNLALAAELPGAEPHDVPAAGWPFAAPARRLRLVTDPETEPVEPVEADCPEAAARARVDHFMRVVVEVLAGVRPSAQLARCTTTAVLPVVHNLARFVHLWCRGVPLLRTHNVVCVPADGVAEGSAHLRLDGMPLLVAFRLERDATHRRAAARPVRGAWLCTVFQHAGLRGLPATR